MSHKCEDRACMTCHDAERWFGGRFAALFDACLKKVGLMRASQTYPVLDDLFSMYFEKGIIQRERAMRRLMSSLMCDLNERDGKISPGCKAMIESALNAFIREDQQCNLARWESDAEKPYTIRPIASPGDLKKIAEELAGSDSIMSTFKVKMAGPDGAIVENPLSEALTKVIKQLVEAEKAPGDDEKIH